MSKAVGSGGSGNGEAQGRKSATKGNAIDKFMDAASEALVATNYFDAENNCLRALRLARNANDFDSMARIVLPLQEARRQRRHAACDVSDCTVLSCMPDAEESLVTGRYMLEPPLVGIMGRQLREFASRQRVPIMVLVREPATRMGKWPIVGVGTGPREPVVVRVQVEPPKQCLDVAWYLSSHEALGDAAIRKAPRDVPADHHVDDLLDYLEAVPDHEKLIQALAEACRIAAKVPLSTIPRRRPLIEDAYSF